MIQQLISQPCYPIILSHFVKLTITTHHQWEFQDPKMEVQYHIFGHMLPGSSFT